MTAKTRMDGWKLVCNGKGCKETLRLKENDYSTHNFREGASNEHNWLSTGKWIPRDYCPECGTH